MAQWMGQFSGNTHLTRIQDREAQLRRAIDIYVSKEGQAERDSYNQTLIKFSERLLDARIKALRAQISSLDPRDENIRVSIETKIQRMTLRGIDAILEEFGAVPARTENDDDNKP
ncbi:hypothetical protein SH449x_003627 [Pirellulaceae bacterium SH449]